MLDNLRYAIVFLIALPLTALAQSAKDSNAAVLLLNPWDSLPAGAVATGDEIKIIDRGFALYCTYNEVLNEGRLQASRNGANILKVSEWRTPGGKSACFGLKGRAYQVNDINALRIKVAAAADSVMKSFLPDSATYALLHIYQPGGLGAFNAYNVLLGDSVICRIRNSYYYTLKIRREGKLIVRAQKGSGSGIPLDVHFGNAYFIKCGLVQYGFSSRPMLQLLDMKTAVEQLRLYKLMSASY